MLKAYKYRIYPTKVQIELIEKHFGSAKFLYNYFLDYRQKEYAKDNKIGYIQTQSELTKMKKLESYKWLNECGSQSLQMSLRALDNGFTKFFKKQGSYPKFKSKKHTHQSFTAPQNIKVANNRVYLPKFTKVGIKVKLHREVLKEGILKQATISRINNQYFISILIEDGKEVPNKVKAKSAIGIDMGLENFIITSDGLKYINKRYFVKLQKKLKKLQKRLSKKKKGSNNREKAKLRVQRVHTKITNQRRDYLQKISNEITNQYDIICLESLNIKGMIRNRKLAKSITDVAWSEFIRQLEYKSLWRGKTVVKIDKWFPSSQLCSLCGANTGKKTLNIRKFDCHNCGVKNIDRDINASINIRNYGLGQLDNRYTAGTVEIKACGVSSNGAIFDNIASYDIMKQEAPSSLAIE